VYISLNANGGQEIPNQYEKIEDLVWYLNTLIQVKEIPYQNSLGFDQVYIEDLLGITIYGFWFNGEEIKRRRNNFSIDGGGKIINEEHPETLH
jgi:hypothetical protein